MDVAAEEPAVTGNVASAREPVRDSGYVVELCKKYLVALSDLVTLLNRKMNNSRHETPEGCVLAKEFARKPICNCQLSHDSYIESLDLKMKSQLG